MKHLSRDDSGNRLTSKLFLTAAACVLAVAGCSNPDDAKLATLKANMQAQQNVISRSNGSWDSLSDADKQVLINGPGGGSEAAAQSYFNATFARSGNKPIVGAPALKPAAPKQ